MNPSSTCLALAETRTSDATLPAPPTPQPPAAAASYSTADDPGEAEYASWLRMIRFPFAMFA